MTKEYYVFESGQRISGVNAYQALDVARGFNYIDKGKVSKAKVLKEFLKDNHSFLCSGGVDPFECSECVKGGSCK